MRKRTHFAIMLAWITGQITGISTVVANAQPPAQNPVMRSYAVAYNAKYIEYPQGFIQHKTTYMDVTDIVYLVQAMNIHCVWGNDNFIMGTPLPVDEPKHVNANATLYLSGQAFASIPVVHLTQHTRTKAYLPIWYVMQALDKLGQRNSWNGHQWTVGHLFA